MFPVYGSGSATAQVEPAVVRYQPDLDESTVDGGAIQNAHNKIQQLVQILPDAPPIEDVPTPVRPPELVTPRVSSKSTDPTDFNEFAQRVGVKDGYTAPEVSDDQLLADVEKTYSTAQAAAFFPSKKKSADGGSKDMSNQWMYWGLKNNLFVDLEGKPITPLMVGKRRRFTLDHIQAIALSWHRRGNLSLDELKVVMRRVLIARHGIEAFDSEEPPTS